MTDKKKETLLRAALLMRTVAESGCQSFYEDGSPTPNRELHLEIAADLEALAADLTLINEGNIEQASQPPLCEACEVRHWPMQNTLCPATEQTWAGVYKARGYKLVPIEPTLDMYNAACKAYCAWEVKCAEELRAGNEFSQPNFTHSDVYRAMIAVAPKKPAAKRESVPETDFRR